MSYRWENARRDRLYGKPLTGVKVDTHELADKVYQASFNHPYKLNRCDVADTRIPLHGLSQVLPLRFSVILEGIKSQLFVRRYLNVYILSAI